ncbi:unnamed protein product [Cuscuta epithymum]|uniref:Uncharacterized protein n=1 Tax=Cuscuta epithymum TaxID=186058 RepID=A0AAV0CKU0_9ASTE|nr:unnamed protein product [Cuscuta epithymum]
MLAASRSYTIRNKEGVDCYLYWRTGVVDVVIETDKIRRYGNVVPTAQQRKRSGAAAVVGCPVAFSSPLFFFPFFFFFYFSSSSPSSSSSSSTFSLHLLLDRSGNFFSWLDLEIVRWLLLSRPT